MQTARVQWAGRPLLIDPLFSNPTSDNFVLHRPSWAPAAFGTTAAIVTSEIEETGRMKTEKTKVRFLEPITAYDKADFKRKIKANAPVADDEGYQASDELEDSDGEEMEFDITPTQKQLVLAVQRDPEPELDFQMPAPVMDEHGVHFGQYSDYESPAPGRSPSSPNMQSHFSDVTASDHSLDDSEIDTPPTVREPATRIVRRSTKTSGDRPAEPSQSPPKKKRIIQISSDSELELPKKPKYVTIISSDDEGESSQEIIVIEKNPGSRKRPLPPKRVTAPRRVNKYFFK